MPSLPRRLLRRARRMLRRGSVRHEGAVLPPRELRYCGRSFSDDAYFLASAVAEADRLRKHPGLGPETRLLEIGCGPGRLPIGLLHTGAPLGAYEGVDIDRRSIEWCRRHITRRSPAFRFHVVGARHDRYNPGGPEMDEHFALPFPDRSFDLVYLHSVFANLLEKDVRVYSREFARLLAPGGRVFLTMFVEEDVPSVTVNPEDYVMPTSGPLHIVRWERGYLERLFEEEGLGVERFDHRAGLGGQSEIYLERRAP